MKTIQQLMCLRILDFCLFHVCNLFCCIPLRQNATEPHSEIFWLAIVARLRFETKGRTSLVAQWLRIRLPMQGTRVQSLVQEDPTCRGATKPVHHSYRACTLEPASHSYGARMPQLLKPARLDPVLCNKRSHCNEKPTHHNEE